MCRPLVPGNGAARMYVHSKLIHPASKQHQQAAPATAQVFVEKTCRWVATGVVLATANRTPECAVRTRKPHARACRLGAVSGEDAPHLEAQAPHASKHGGADFCTRPAFTIYTLRSPVLSTASTHVKTARRTPCTRAASLLGPFPLPPTPWTPKVDLCTAALEPCQECRAPPSQPAGHSLQRTCSRILRTVRSTSLNIERGPRWAQSDRSS